MRPPGTLDEWPLAVGSVFNSRWVKVSTSSSLAYAQAAHHDLVYGPAGASDYPDGLIDGFHLLGLLDWLSATVIGTWHGYNYGLDRVRFPASATSHDWLRLRVKVERVEPRAGGQLVTYDCRVDLRGQVKPALVASWKILLLPPHTSDD